MECLSFQVMGFTITMMKDVAKEFYEYELPKKRKPELKQYLMEASGRFRSNVHASAAKQVFTARAFGGGQALKEKMDEFIARLVEKRSAAPPRGRKRKA